MLHCCRAPRRSEGVTAGSRTRYPMVLGWASLPPCNFSGPAPCPMPHAQGVCSEKWVRLPWDRGSLGTQEGRPHGDTPLPGSEQGLAPSCHPAAPGPGRGGAGTVFIHVDLQALLQPAGPALVPVRLVHRAASLQHSQPSSGAGGGGEHQCPHPDVPSAARARAGGCRAVPSWGA